MSMFTEVVSIGPRRMEVPLRCDGPTMRCSRDDKQDVITCTFNRGTLVYSLGVASSRMLPNIGAKHWEEYAQEMHSKNEEFLMARGLRAGPSVFVRVPEILYGLTPVLVPDRVHLEHLIDDLQAAKIAVPKIEAATALVNRIRTAAQVLAA